jgi:16S rRNA A1518/A1519 N6-dimethyltransferase RsmA/KsgA/DIM1 with predicted DNA glycosylase/AP lyase activity
MTKYPDAKVLDIAAQLGDPVSAPILDVGAGTGRNTLPLARLGNPVDVVELTPEFTEQIQAVATAEGLAINITQDGYEPDQIAATTTASAASTASAANTASTASTASTIATQSNIAGIVSTNNDYGIAATTAIASTTATTAIGIAATIAATIATH